MTSGVRQGCVLASAALFCRAMDYIMECVSRKVSIQVGQLTFTDIDYADDVALLVDKEESFRTALTDGQKSFQVRSSDFLDQDKAPES